MIFGLFVLLYCISDALKTIQQHRCMPENVIYRVYYNPDCCENVVNLIKYIYDSIK